MSEFPITFKVSIPTFELLCKCHVGGSSGQFGTDVKKLYDHIRTTSGSSDPEFETAQAVHFSLDIWKNRLVREVVDRGEPINDNGFNNIQS